ncbi:predicted protein [Streptomyces sp. SPB78]|nr:predicted protein [Streptomyces sp. SPB78]
MTAGVAEGRVQQADHVDAVAGKVDRHVHGDLGQVAGGDAGGTDGGALGTGVGEGGARRDGGGEAGGGDGQDGLLGDAHGCYSSTDAFHGPWLGAARWETRRGRVGSRDSARLGAFTTVRVKNGGGGVSG